MGLSQYFQFRFPMDGSIHPAASGFMTQLEEAMIKSQCKTWRKAGALESVRHKAGRRARQDRGSVYV
jgi:hypothetical protein